MGCPLFYLQGEVGEQGPAGRPGEKVCSTFIRSVRAFVSIRYASCHLSPWSSQPSRRALIYLPHDGRHVLRICRCGGYWGHHHCQEQLNRCSEWGHAGGGGHRSPSRSDLGDVRRGRQEVTSWLIQRKEESDSKRGETGSWGGSSKVRTTWGLPMSRLARICFPRYPR